MKRTTQADAHNYFNQLALLPIVTDTLSHAEVSAITYELGVQYGSSVYDGAYLELAMRLGGELATTHVHFQDGCGTHEGWGQFTQLND